MIKRVFDIVTSLSALILFLPLFVLCMVGIVLSSRGPLIYRAQRAGLNGKPFEMYKFRSMHTSISGARITSLQDRRVFWFGSIMRKLKFDELPQFVNVLLGQMSIVGPRPEDIEIVRQHYKPWMLETLNVKPGITSPGSILYYAEGERLVDPLQPEASYVANLLPKKLSVDRAYLERANALSDIVCMFHTFVSVIGIFLGRPVMPLAQDLAAARKWHDPRGVE